MGLGKVTFSSKGSMRGQYDFLMANHTCSNLYGRLVFSLSLYPPPPKTMFVGGGGDVYCFHVVRPSVHP